MKLVVDANIVVKWYREESDSRQALLFRQLVLKQEHTAIVPFLLFVEAINVLVMRYHLPYQALKLVITDLTNFPCEIVPYSHPLLGLAAHSSLQHRLAIYDGIYLALAQHLNIKLLSQDDKVIDAAPKHCITLDELIL